MNLTWILLIVLAGVVVYATTLWKKIAKLEHGLRDETRLLEERKDELEKAKRESRERRDELEEAKKHLTEARNKLKKRERDEQPEQPSSKKARPSAREEPAATASPVIVRISDQEIATEHQRTVQKLEDEIAALRSELATSKKREEQRARDAEKATKALEAAAAAVPQAVAQEMPVAPPPPAPVSVSEDVAALHAQLDAMKKVAVDRERELKREIRKAHDETKHALRRAANNQALYAVLHGQLELAEDRLAAYKLKYEGAKSIEELRREAKRDRPRRQRGGDREQRRAENGGASETTIPPPVEEQRAEATIPPVANEAPPSTIEVSKEDIVSARPSETIPPEPAKPEA
jgi:hypothetical protein